MLAMLKRRLRLLLEDTDGSRGQKIVTNWQKIEARDSFEDAFRTGGAGCVRQCHCGREFYNSDGCWDWNDGELDGLRERGATDLPYSVGTIHFDANEYVIDCSCWHTKASNMVRYLEAYRRQIAIYYEIERARRIKEAKERPIVETK